jgi:ABC-type lipoprotein release transport system permease subunit
VVGKQGESEPVTELQYAFRQVGRRPGFSLLVVVMLAVGVTSYAPFVLVAAVAVLSTAVFGAGYLPARRASRVAPMEALRYD